jgi:tetratricopeptide (TPR) repeat protein
VTTHTLSFEMGARLQEARAAYLDGRLVEAEYQVREILNAYPDNPEAMYLIGAIAYRAGKHDAAIRWMKRVVELTPRHHDAQLTLGMAYRVQRNPRDARGPLKKALALKPSSFDARFNLAVTELELGETKAALRNLERAVKVEPNSAQVRNTYAGALYQSGDREEFLRQLRKGASLVPDDAEMQFNLGVGLANVGQHEEAMKQFRRALALKPDHVDSKYGLANSLSELKRYDEAAEIYGAVLEAMPTAAGVRNNYGLVLRLANRPHEAIDQLKRALQDSHGQPFIAGTLAEAMVHAGKADEALTVLRASAENSPSDAIFLKMSELLARLGKFPEAVTQFERLLRRQPETVAALVALAELQGSAIHKTHVDKLTALAKDEKRLPSDRMRVHLALGHLADLRGAYDEAFAHFTEANRIRGERRPFDLSELRSFVDRQIATFTPELLRDKRAAASQSDVPVFVVGLHRSGTTIAERMIGAHPKGYALGDGQDLAQLAARLPAAMTDARDFPEFMRDLPAHTGRAAADQLAVRRQKLAPQALRIADKSTGAWQYVGLARTLLPRAGVVHVTREPMDALFGIFRQHVSGAHRYPSDLAALGAYWREYRRLLQHWRSLAPTIDIAYEDLVQKTESTAQQLLQGIGLPWDAAVLRFAEVKQPFSTGARLRIRQPLSADRIGHWQHYAPFLKPLESALTK